MTATCSESPTRSGRSPPRATRRGRRLDSLPPRDIPPTGLVGAENDSVDVATTFPSRCQIHIFVGGNVLLNWTVM